MRLTGTGKGPSRWMQATIHCTSHREARTQPSPRMPNSQLTSNGLAPSLNSITQTLRWIRLAQKDAHVTGPAESGLSGPGSDGRGPFGLPSCWCFSKPPAWGSIVCTTENRLNFYTVYISSSPLTKSFLLFLSSVLGATTLTIPPQGTPHLICIVACTDLFSSSKLQKPKKKRSPQKYSFLMTPSEYNSYRSPSAHVLLKRALLEPKRRGLRPECHPDELAPALLPYAFSFHSCRYPMSISTIGNQRRGLCISLSTASSADTAS
jgi:hypothetical protein